MNVKSVTGDKFTHLIHIRRQRNVSIHTSYYLKILCRKFVVTLMNSFQRWGLSYALGGRSTEYLSPTIRQSLQCDINLKYVLIGSSITSYCSRHTSHVSDSLFTLRLSDNMFLKPDIRRSYFHFLLVQVTLPNSCRKIKRVRWVICRWLVTASHSLFIRSTRCFVTYQMF